MNTCLSYATTSGALRAGLVEACVLMPVGVLHGCEQPMMRQVVGIVDPRDCTDRREDQQVRPEIIPLNMGE